MNDAQAQQPAYCGGLSCEKPIATAVDVLSGRWSVAVIEAVHFAGSAIRFRDLQRGIQGISPKELSRHLAHLSDRGVLARAGAGSGLPARAGYVLTESGRRLLRHMQALGEWAREDAEPRPPDTPATWMDPIRRVLPSR